MFRINRSLQKYYRKFMLNILNATEMQYTCEWKQVIITLLCWQHNNAVVLSIWYLSFIIIIVNVTRTQSVKDYTLITALRQRWTVPSCQNNFWLYEVLFISIRRMPFLAPTLEDANSLLALEITSGFYQHQIEVTDLGPARGCL